ncbi:hypothetical protein O181_096871 [Austropuccinia psidii MF-1]|uniref:Uncharacterized protein n=1 Tax=Austropuccinia psidii MF-1 TaxID=1389203 RepID=A0A9Q3J7W8_9BASI|nr:hypothetical protein [Austropuccinia psidii MF-1]
MGRDMTDIIPDAEPEVSSAANFQGIFLSRMEEFAGILNYHSNISQQSWKRGLDNINRIYKNRWDNLPTKDAHTFLPVGIKVISNRDWQSLLYPANPVKHFWANLMFESISLVSYNVIAPKPYVALTSNLTNPLGLERGEVEYLSSCLSKMKQRATQLSIEGGRADNEISTKLHKNLEDLMDTVIHLMIVYNMVRAHTKVEVNGIKGKLTISKNEAIKDLLKCHKNLGINQICYGILAAFCVAGVCEGKNLVEPVWLFTNKYICYLLDKSFFSSESFNPTVPLKFEFAQCLVLDFGDAWVAKHGLGSSDEVTLTVPREVKGCLPNKAPWALGTILDSKLLSFKWEEAVSDILSASTHSDHSTTWE